jgi:hypothetical protein
MITESSEKTCCCSDFVRHHSNYFAQAKSSSKETARMNPDLLQIGKDSFDYSLIGIRYLVALKLHLYLLQLKKMPVGLLLRRQP